MCLTRMLIEDLHLHYIIVCDVLGMHYRYIVFPLALWLLNTPDMNVSYTQRVLCYDYHYEHNILSNYN